MPINFRKFQGNKGIAVISKEFAAFEVQIFISDRQYRQYIQGVEWENMNRIFVPIVLILSLVGSVSALDLKGNIEMKPGEAAFEQLYNHGIGQPWVGGNPPGQQEQDHVASGGATFSQYSQYFTIPQGNAPKNHIEAPKKHDIEGKTPTTIYFGYQMHAVPYSQFQMYAT